jgi:hypothetical protein
MNHQPFEDWLLNEKTLNTREKLELELHLRMCSHCSALSASGRVLRSVKRASPAAGFTARFQARLAAFLSFPATWIAALIDWGIFVMTTLRALAQASSVIVDVIPGFLSPFGWMVLVSAGAGISLLWSVSIWRFAQGGVPRGV